MMPIRDANIGVRFLSVLFANLPLLRNFLVGSCWKLLG
jgi:hypothetical protein